MSINNFDSNAVTEEGYVLCRPDGQYLQFNERYCSTSRFGTETTIRETRLAFATIFPSKQGPLNSTGIAALECYVGVHNIHLETLHVTRTNLITISVDPVKRPRATHAQ